MSPTSALGIILCVALAAKAQNCEISVTTRNLKNVCKRSVIFDETFDFLDEKRWQKVSRLSSEDLDSAIYSRLRNTAYIENGRLVIGRTILTDKYVKGSRIELKDCTGSSQACECSKSGTPQNILPGVVTGQICTKESFSFKYGVVQVRAKLPLGNWVAPQIWLKPATEAYGPGYRSGKIRIAMSRGNPQLTTPDGYEIGSRLVESGILVSVGETENIQALVAIAQQNIPWGSDFHNFTLRWAPNSIGFSFEDDGSRLINVVSTNDTISLPELMGLERGPFKSGSQLAPFDNEFYICLGLSVANQIDFPDGSFSDGLVKPWKNHSPEALGNFWAAKENWQRTWSEDTSFIVDRVTDPGIILFSLWLFQRLVVIGSEY